MDDDKTLGGENLQRKKDKIQRKMREVAADPQRRGELFLAYCPSREVLRHVTSRWGVLVLVALRGGTQRFSDLRRKIDGVSEKMLAQTLQWLETDGFVARRSFPVVPPRVEYSLTPLGQELAECAEHLAGWIESNLPRVLQAQRQSAEES